jgi:hypothetical protein
MWTLKQRRAASAILAGAFAAVALLTATPGRAVEYVQVCSAAGVGYFLVPNSDTCMNANQIVANQFAIARATTQAATGTAMAASLVNPWLPDGTNHAISIHWAGFDGENAIGIAALKRIKGNLAFSAGFSVGLDYGSLRTLQNRTATEFVVANPDQTWSNIILLGRVGLQYAW